MKVMMRWRKREDVRLFRVSHPCHFFTVASLGKSDIRISHQRQHRAADHHLPLFNMAELNWVTIAAIIAGTLISIPIIMGFFGGNKFDVKGKVIVLQASDTLKLTATRQSSSPELQKV